MEGVKGLPIGPGRWRGLTRDGKEDELEIGLTVVP